MVRTLFLTNTLTGVKEAISFLSSPVKMYVCGVTPYDYAHLGHGRCYVVFDVLVRVLKTRGYEICYCRNFTDVDDKLLKRAHDEFGDASRYHEVAERFIEAYTQDMKRLNCLSPDIEPRVTEHIPQIIAFIEALIARGHAYVIDNDVYFSIDTDPDYGKLSHRDLNDLRAGARVAVSEKKRNPLDFALWKGDESGPGWQSPWGKGRPGWHIECSVLSSAYLGETIDIHGGGMDLIFPHHENELAQSESRFGVEFVRTWMHNAFVRIDKEKMSKSLGNFFSLRDVFEKYDPMVVRYMIMQHHYRSPLDFSFDELDVAHKTYNRVCRLFEGTTAAQSLEESSIAGRMFDALMDDLNMPAAWGILFENWKELQENAQERAAVKYLLQAVFGLALQVIEKEVTITPEIQALITEREQARTAKNWARSDALRDELKKLGYHVQDKKQ